MNSEKININYLEQVKFSDTPDLFKATHTLFIIARAKVFAKKGKKAPETSEENILINKINGWYDEAFLQARLDKLLAEKYDSETTDLGNGLKLLPK